LSWTLELSVQRAEARKQSTKYITDRTNLLELPSMILEHLIFEFTAYEQYLRGALQ